MSEHGTSQLADSGGFFIRGDPIEVDESTDTEENQSYKTGHSVQDNLRVLLSGILEVRNTV